MEFVWMFGNGIPLLVTSSILNFSVREYERTDFIYCDSSLTKRTDSRVWMQSNCNSVTSELKDSTKADSEIVCGYYLVSKIPTER